MASEKFDFSVILRVINKATAPLSRIGTAFGTLGAKVRMAGRSFGTFKINSERINKSLDKVGKKLGRGLGLALGAFAVHTVKTAYDFEQSMNKVAAITEATGETMKQLRNQAKELGATTQFSASQAADAMTFLGMAGLNAQQIMEAMPGTLQLAAAGGLELATAADIATNVMTSMGKEAKDLGRINDILAKTATSANTDILQLAEAMRPVAPTAESLGFSLADVSAMLGKMADAGERGSIAGTLLRNAMLSLVKPSKSMNNLFDELGANVTDFVEDGKIKNFAGLIELIGKKQIDTGKLFKAFGERGARAVLLLTKKGKDLKEFTKALENSEGTAERMANTMMKGLPGAVKEFKSAFEAVQLSIMEGDIGKNIEDSLRGLAEILRDISKMEGISSLPDLFGAIGDRLAAATKGAGLFKSVLLSIGAAISKYLGGMLEILKGFATGGIIGAVKGLVTSPEKKSPVGEGAKAAVEALKSETVVKVLVQSAEGSTATIEDIKKKKGNAKVESRTNNVLQPQLFQAAGGVR